MKRLIAVGFMLALGVLVLVAYGFLPSWIFENNVYTILINGVFLVGFIFLLFSAIKGT